MERSQRINSPLDVHAEAIRRLGAAFKRAGPNLREMNAAFCRAGRIVQQETRIRVRMQRTGCTREEAIAAVLEANGSTV